MSANRRISGSQAWASLRVSPASVEYRMTFCRPVSSALKPAPHGLAAEECAPIAADDIPEWIQLDEAAICGRQGGHRPDNRGEPEPHAEQGGQCVADVSREHI
jgi:hypothetical protein